jgi:integrase
MKLRLTDTQISKARARAKPRKLTDGRGLYIEITPSGSKLWRYRFRLSGKESVFAAGEYCQAPIGETESQARDRIASERMTLAEARIEREKWRAQVKRGINPAHQRKLDRQHRTDAAADTFGAVAREWMAKRGKKWSKTYAARVGRHLENDVFGEIGAMPVRSITAAHIRQILERAEQRDAPVVALHLRMLCSQVFKYAAANLKADSDPAAVLEGMVQRPTIEHRKPLPLKEIPALLRSIESSTSTKETKTALRLLLLVFLRPGELCGLKWSEIDFEAKLLRIPASKMKGRREHLVPLSRQVVALLRELHRSTGKRTHLFPSQRDPRRGMNMTTLNKVLDLIGYAGRYSAHSARATASTILNELGYRGDLVEKQLAHGERDQVRASYNAAQYLEERRQMMQAYSDLVLSDGKVVTLRRSAA